MKIKSAFRRYPSPPTIRGSVLVLVLPLSFFLFSMVLLISHWGRAHYLLAKAEITAEAVLVSVLRLKADAWRELAHRSEELSPHVASADEGGLTLVGPVWEAVASHSSFLKNALPGYKGRIRSSVKVLMEAQGLSKEDLVTAGADLSELEIKTQGGWVADPDGSRRWIEGFWLGRTWGSSHRLAEPQSWTIFRVQLTDPVFGPLSGRAAGRLRWDVSRKLNDVEMQGNGGYPRRWEETVYEGAFRPHRKALYRAATQSVERGENEAE